MANSEPVQRPRVAEGRVLWERFSRAVKSRMRRLSAAIIEAPASTWIVLWEVGMWREEILPPRVEDFSKRVMFGEGFSGFSVRK